MTWDGTDLDSMMGLGSEPTSIAGSVLGSLDGTHYLTAAPSFLREGCGDVQGGSFLLPLVTLFVFNIPPSCPDMTPPKKASPGALPAPVSPVPPLQTHSGQSLPAWPPTRDTTSHSPELKANTRSIALSREGILASPERTGHCPGQKGTRLSGRHAWPWPPP